MPWLLLLLAAGAYLYYVQGKDFKTYYKLKFIDSIFNLAKTKAALFTKIFFSIRVEVENTTEFAGTLDNAKLNLSYKGKNLGVVTLDKPVTIVKKDKTKVEIPVAVPTLSLISNITELIQAVKKKEDITFNVKGTLQFAVGTVTVNENYKVALK